MTTVTPRAYLDSLTIVSGRFDADALTLYTVMRDEMFFLPAFLDHYRRIGVEQFLILEDGSTDGGAEYLADQPDVVLLHSPHGFNDMLRLRRAGRPVRRRSGGIVFKELAPQRFFPGRFSIYADTDEFLMLPAGIESLQQVIASLQSRRQRSCAASVVEAFPEDVSGLSGDPAPKSLTDLLALYPWFEPRPVVALRRWRKPRNIGRSKTIELFARTLPEYAGDAADRLPGSARLKTPILREGWLSQRRGSHKCLLPPSPDILLTMFHFVFTAQFRTKIDRVHRINGRAGRGANYDRYARMLTAMEAGDMPFRTEASVRYRDPAQLIEAGLMRWPG